MPSNNPTPLYERIPSLSHDDKWWVPSEDFKLIEKVLHKLADALKYALEHGQDGDYSDVYKTLAEYRALMNENEKKEG